nr:GTP cyclohydrolase I [Streptomyces qaidamensis]
MAHESDGIDLAAAETAAGRFLGALGIDTASESLRGTPGRMARAYAEFFSPRPFDLTTFPNDEGYDELFSELPRSKRCCRLG